MFDSFASNSRFDFFAEWFDRLSGRDRWSEVDGQVIGNVWLPPDEGLDGYYRVNYVYRAGAKEFTGWFGADAARPLGEVVVVRYNPNNPKRKFRAGFRSGREPLILVVIITGAAVFFAVWYSINIMVP